jgi:hypothetical protein
VELSIKNVILYDAHGHVSGFVELKIRESYTAVKVRHNLFTESANSTAEERNLLLSVTADGAEPHVFAFSAVQAEFDIRARIDPACEIVVCIIGKKGASLATVASGAVNEGIGGKSADRGPRTAGDEELKAKNERRVTADMPDITFPPPPTNTALDAAGDTQEKAEPVKSAEAREVDAVLRAVCEIDEGGRGVCETCPYRDYFFEFTLDRDRTEPAPAPTASTAAGLFFDIIKNQIENILAANAPHAFLNDAIDNARFVIMPAADGAEHALGVIYDEANAPKYLCSAVSAESRTAPPAELSGYAQWLPRDPQKPGKAGFWLSFQSAETGEAARVQ